MVKVALFVRLEAKPGKEKEVESFLAPLSPALRHISDLIRLRAVKHFLASRQSQISGSSATTAGFSELTIRSSRVRFAASAPAVMIEPPPRPLRCPA